MLGLCTLALLPAVLDAARLTRSRAATLGAASGEAVANYSSPPTSFTVWDILQRADSQGWDHNRVRDQLRMEYPSWEWVVLRMGTSNYGWAAHGDLQAGYNRHVVIGYDCPGAPSCGRCSSEKSTAHSLNRAADDAGERRTNIRNALGSGAQNVLAATTPSWDVAVSAQPEGSRCLSYGVDMASDGRYKFFAFQMRSGSGAPSPPTSAPTPTPWPTSTARPTPAPPTGSCEQETDCDVNLFCNRPGWQERCRDWWQEGRCPRPYCRRT